jgi:hypothetical protein
MSAENAALELTLESGRCGVERPVDECLSGLFEEESATGGEVRLWYDGRDGSVEDGREGAISADP